MLCSRLNKIPHIQWLLVRHTQIRSFGVSKSKCPWRNSVFGALRFDPMSSYKLRLILRDFTVARLWNACFRTQLLSTVVKRCRRERVRGVWVCFRQTLLRPSRTLLLSVAAYNAEDDTPAPCNQDISDEDLEALVHDFEGVDELSRATLFCEGCRRRVVIDKKHPGVMYCKCSNTHPPGPSEDGWLPYMEADDVIIWRKEYKPGGLFAYKVYGRYKDLAASDFAMIQVDGAYRRSWDDAVAALSIVEPEANGVRSQAVLHWEVLWPRLFANRDYVYLRRHKEFEMKSKCLAHKEAIFSNADVEPCEEPPALEERPNVHTRAKLKSLEMERQQRQRQADGKMEDKLNKVYVIVSRSCTHPDAPETRNAVRVQEYWSHMVVRTINGADAVGMEFVLTYYDEPSVGGLPAGVSAWATGRAAPSYLARMRRAAQHYPAWRHSRQELPDFEPFDSSRVAPRPVDHGKPRPPPAVRVKIDELDMESSKLGPELDGGYEPQHKSTQTDAPRDAAVDAAKHFSEIGVGEGEVKLEKKVKTMNTVKADSEVKPTGQVKTSEVIVTEKVKANKVKANDEVKVGDEVKASDGVKVTETVKPSDTVKVTSKELESNEDAGSDKKEDQTEGPEGDESQNGSWWRYLYPFYYFV